MIALFIEIAEIVCSNKKPVEKCNFLTWERRYDTSKDPWFLNYCYEFVQ